MDDTNPKSMGKAVEILSLIIDYKAYILLFRNDRSTQAIAIQ
jgi:hypothetical protein